MISDQTRLRSKGIGLGKMSGNDISCPLTTNQKFFVGGWWWLGGWWCPNLKKKNGHLRFVVVVRCNRGLTGSHRKKESVNVQMIYKKDTDKIIEQPRA